jgi:uncharacterized protein (TIGR01244 family)
VEPDGRHIPVSDDSLSGEVVDGFRREIARLPKPVLVHCASGKRSGAFAMMDVAVEQGMSGEEVIRKAEAMGFECDQPGLERFVRDYVDWHRSGARA